VRTTREQQYLVIGKIQVTGLRTLVEGRFSFSRSEEETKILGYKYDSLGSKLPILKSSFFPPSFSLFRS
jgi:hypothetical protein